MASAPSLGVSGGDKTGGRFFGAAFSWTSFVGFTVVTATVSVEALAGAGAGSGFKTTDLIADPAAGVVTCSRSCCRFVTL